MALTKARIVTALAVAAALFLGYQHLTLWYKGSAYSTVYAQPHLPKVVRLKPMKGEAEATVNCVSVRAIVPASRVPTQRNPTPISSRGTIEPTAIGALAGQSPTLESVSLLPEYPLLLSRYVVKAPVLSDLTLESYLDKDGTNRIVPATKDLQKKLSLFEMGKLREFGFWAGPEWENAGLPDPHQSDTQSSQFGYSFDFSYKQDLIRFGPAWSGLRAEVGYGSISGARAKLQIGIPIFRF